MYILLNISLVFDRILSTGMVYVRLIKKCENISRIGSKISTFSERNIFTQKNIWFTAN